MGLFEQADISSTSVAGLPTDFDTVAEARYQLELNDGNHYTVTGGVNITLQGTMCSGRFIDITRGIDFIQARMQEALFGQLVNTDKIPFTNIGVGGIETHRFGLRLDDAHDLSVLSVHQAHDLERRHGIEFGGSGIAGLGCRRLLHDRTIDVGERCANP